MVELRRSHEYLDHFRSDRSARVDYIKSAGLSSQEVLRGFHVRTAGYVNAPQNGVPFYTTYEQLGSVSPQLVSLSTGTELDTLTI